MTKLQISQRYQLLQVGDESSLRRIAKVGDVVNVRGGCRERAPQNLFQAGTINTGPQPIGAHVVGRGQVILPRIRHGKQLREGPAKAGQKPVRIVLDRPFGRVMLLHEISDHFNDHVFRHSVQVELHRMLRPVAAPIVI